MEALPNEILYMILEVISKTHPYNKVFNYRLVSKCFDEMIREIYLVDKLSICTSKKNYKTAKVLKRIHDNGAAHEIIKTHLCRCNIDVYKIIVSTSYWYIQMYTNYTYYNGRKMDILLEKNRTPVTNNFTINYPIDINTTDNIVKDILMFTNNDILYANNLYNALKEAKKLLNNITS